jgi:tetratricopeptide (TPR) repeat protein
VIEKLMVLGLVFVTLSSGLAASALAQTEAENRKAAAEAYDRGTAAFLAEDFAKAAQWFETAYRLAPAYQALLQAIRAHLKGGNEPRAATLAVEINIRYAAETAAVEYASKTLAEIEPNYYRVEVSCDRCSLEVNGTLQEYTTFFLEPDMPHTLVAHFDSGDVQEEVSGTAGESRMVLFERPLGQTGTIDDGGSMGGGGDFGEEPEPSDTDGRKPLPPIVTFIGGGLTLALGVATVVVGIDAQAGVKEYEKAADEAEEARSPDSDNYEIQEDLREKANDLLEKGQAKELRTNILIGVTAGVAVATGVIAIFFTDWAGEAESEPEVSMGVAPLAGGAMATVRTSF